MTHIPSVHHHHQALPADLFEGQDTHDIEIFEKRSKKARTKIHENIKRHKKKKRVPASALQQSSRRAIDGVQ